MSVTRPELGRIWALSGARFDPGTQKYTLGWTAEIPTYEVLNYLQYRVDLALLSTAQRGIPEWGSDLTYGLGSVVWDNKDSRIYVSKVAVPSKSKAPSDNPADWELSSTQFTMTSFLSLNGKIDDHIAARNDPHNVTADQVGTYTSSVIDSKISKVAGDITAHTGRRDNPHGTTAEQAGAVPKTGGEYLGPVTFSATETKVNPGAGDHAVRADSEMLSLRFEDIYLGIRKSDKRAVVKTPSGTEVLMNEQEYVETRKEIEPEYAVPSPDFHVDAINDVHIKAGFHTSQFVRSGSRPYTDKAGRPAVAEDQMPRHAAGGLLLENGGTNVMLNNGKITAMRNAKSWSCTDPDADGWMTLQAVSTEGAPESAYGDFLELAGGTRSCYIEVKKGGVDAVIRMYRGDAGGPYSATVRDNGVTSSSGGVKYWDMGDYWRIHVVGTVGSSNTSKPFRIYPAPAAGGSCTYRYVSVFENSGYVVNVPHGQTVGSEQFYFQGNLNYAGFQRATIMVEAIWDNPGQDTVLFWDQSGNNEGIYIRSDGRVEASWLDTGGVIQRVQCGRLTFDNRPFKVVATFDEQTSKGYLNGVLGETKDIAFVSSESREYRVYCRPHGGSFTLRQLKIWNEVLSTEQISTL